MVPFDPLAHQEIIVRMENIVKRFPGVLANDHVNFEVRRGEIHALLGENGAGKTTLMNILYGIHRPDSGRIYVRGKPASIRSPKDAIDLGIGMVHQHFKLVETHTVIENILLGLKEPRFLLRTDKAERRLLELSSRYGLKVDPRAKVWQLSMGERQRVEILKILFREAQVLILDEPTSVLTPLETRELFALLRRMADEGKSIIFITHKLDEVMSVADRVTVLRAGRVVATSPVGKVTKEELASLMVGRKVVFRLERAPGSKGREVLEVKDLQIMGDRGLMAVKGVSFTVHAGEILGIAGIAGNGQRELAEAIAGLRPIASGKLLLEGKDFTGASARKLLKEGVAYIPEDRISVGAPLGLTVEEALILRCYEPALTKGMLLDMSMISERAQKLVKEFNVVTSSTKALTRTLSGGNLQRLILARELSGNPKLIVAEYPTRGLDVAATEYIRELLIKQRGSGSAILLISEDLDEILTLSDRIAVMYDGRIVGIFEGPEVNVEEIGLLMGGAMAKPAKA